MNIKVEDHVGGEMAKTLCGIRNGVANSYGSCCLKNSLSKKMRDMTCRDIPRHLSHTKLESELLNPEQNNCPLSTTRGRTEPGPRALNHLPSLQLGNLSQCNVSSAD